MNGQHLLGERTRIVHVLENPPPYVSSVAGNREKLVITSLGGLLPEQPPEVCSTLHTLLAVGSGPGEWCLDVAASYNMHVIGIDPNPHMITHARRLAKYRHIGNADFVMHPLISSLPFPDEEFDLISVHLPSQIMGKFVLQECWRLLKPNGIIRIMAQDPGSTNSPAHNAVLRLMLDAAQMSGSCFSLFETPRTILFDLKHWLLYAGFRDITTHRYPVDYSYKANMHEEWKNDFLGIAQLMQQSILQKGLISRDILDLLYKQQKNELDLPTFYGTTFLFTVTGYKKPGNSVTTEGFRQNEQDTAVQVYA